MADLRRRPGEYKTTASVSIPVGLVLWARERARERNETLSAFVTKLLAEERAKECVNA